MAPDTTNNSYMLEIDGGSCYTVGNSAIAANTWAWLDYQNAAAASKITASLTAGKHTVKFIGTEPSVKVDRILAVNDIACVPADTGDNCAVAPDSTAPVASIAAPADGAAVKGTVSVTATATDNKAVTKVEFYVNNVLKTTLTAAPYTYAWNTSTQGNGTYALTVKAYDATGNVGFDTNNVTIGNGDTQAPSVPTNVKATASAYDKGALAWTASTDNTGVTGYEVYRVSGATNQKVATVTSAQYGDTGLKPATAYGYYIVAKDANGNNSPQSLTASATTASEPVTPPTDAATGVIRGKVTGSHRRALADARVTLWSGDKRFQATTNSDGVYRFENIPAGRYRIQFKANGYQAEEDTVRMRASKDVVIENVRLTIKGGSSHWWNRWF
jgi:chitodextrinase